MEGIAFKFGIAHLSSPDLWWRGNTIYLTCKALQIYKNRRNSHTDISGNKMCCMQTDLELVNLKRVLTCQYSFNTISKRFGAKQFIILFFETE